MSSLIEKMLKSGSVKESAVLSESKFFKNRSNVTTELPILNIAFSGELDGGLTSGLTIFAGQSKVFKTMLGLYCLKAYLDHDPEAIALLYDSEFGSTEEYFKGFDIDTSRIIHTPVENVEELKFDITQRLASVERGDKIFILIDSIGNLASKKEIDDAIDGKSVADMSRAKAIKSLFRITTPSFTKKDIPCVAIAHTYSEMSMYPKDIISGGTGLIYSSNQAFIITKAQEKEGTDLSGFKFTINIEKSRFVKEKSKLPFRVLYEGGIQKWSSIFDIAMEAGYITKANQGWYNTVDLETGEIQKPNRRKADIESDDAFFEALIQNPEFKSFVEKRFKVVSKKG